MTRAQKILFWTMRCAAVFTWLALSLWGIAAMIAGMTTDRPIAFVLGLCACILAIVIRVATRKMTLTAHTKEKK